ncbi:MAG TPA: glutamate-1-semialdehyde 2,1-aminomutase [Candidatus Eisenbacteria bacterium]|nr:glutamate-1-semialdehyde 2,1-aminomutase [Candidatus Eisenbacteria bacterium]
MSAHAVGLDPHAALFARAARVTPGSVHSPVRAFAAVGVQPVAIVAAQGARVRDAAGREYVDWIGGWGPALLGHAHPGVTAAVREAAGRGLLFGLASPPEVELAERLAARFPGLDLLRFTATGTEAAMSALRVARAATGRPGVIKFAGCYHGHADAFLVRAGSGAATFGVPDSPGVTAGAGGDTRIARYNDLAGVEAAFRDAPGQVAAMIVEPVAGNMGCVPPEPGFLAGLRAACDRHGALLVFDEVITGLRLGPGGAAARFGVTPDLYTLGKVLGGGMPLAAFGGARALMARVSPAGPVYQAGTFAAHPLSVAAGLAVLDALDRDPGLYDVLAARTARLARGLEAAAAAAGVPLCVQHAGSMWTAFFRAGPVRSWDDAAGADTRRYAAFFRGMLARGVLLPPAQFESAFLSAAHGDAELDATLAAARAALAEAA